MADRVYTSADYERAIAQTASTGTGEPVYDAIAISALRIASLVQTEGVIEGALRKPVKIGERPTIAELEAILADPNPPEVTIKPDGSVVVINETAAAIRAALTKGNGNG